MNNLSIINILKEIKLDKNLGDLSKIEDVNTKVQQYKFEINNIKYTIHFSIDIAENKESVLSIEFGNATAVQKIASKKGKQSADDLYADIENAKHGLTNTGSSMSVFNIVYNVLAKYVEKNKPTYIKYDAVEDNRKKLYISLLKRAEKETGLKFERTLIDPITNYRLTPTSQGAIYKIIY